MKIGLFAVFLVAATALGALTGVESLAPAAWISPARAESLEQCKANCQADKNVCVNTAQAAIDRGDPNSIPDCGDDCSYQISYGCGATQQYCEQDCTAAAGG